MIENLEYELDYDIYPLTINIIQENLSAKYNKMNAKYNHKE